MSPRGWAAQALIGLVQFYRLFFSVWLGAGCRYTPTCSAYAIRALQEHGAVAGAVLTFGRLLRCRPGSEGGADEVPMSPPTWLGRTARLRGPCACHPNTLDDRPRAGLAP